MVDVYVFDQRYIKKQPFSYLMVMSNTILTTKKPWVLLIFALVIINTIVAITSLAGIAGNPLDQIATQPGMLIPASVTATTAGATPAPTAAINGVALLLLLLNVIILFGLSQGHVWSWYLLMFATATSILGAFIGLASSQPLSILPLVVNVIMLAALIHRQVVEAFNLDLRVLPKDGVWGTA